MIIDNFHATYLISRARGDPYALQKRLDKIAATLLANEIEPIPARVLPGNSILIFIKNISIDLAFNLDKMDDRAIAILWTQTIAAEIKKIIPAAAGAYSLPHIDSHLVLFPNRATYLAHFIHDLALGVAPGIWYYQEFNDLDAFSFIDIVKLLCEQNRDIMEEIFLVLNETGGLDKTLEQLTVQDAEYLYSLLPGPPLEPGTKHGTGEYETVAGFISGMVKNGWLDLSAVTPGNYKSCLRIYLVYLSRQKQYPGSAAKTAIKKIIRDIIIENPEFIPGLELSKSQPGTVNKIKTAYGGLFFLIPAILEIELFEIVASLLPAKDNISAMNAILYFMSLNILRRNRAEQPYIDAADPGILTFAGLEPTASTQYLETYPEVITTAMCKEFSKKLLRSITKVFGSPETFFQKGFWPPEAKETIDYETLISALTEIVLKSFALRLKGFEESSPAYLTGNFLQRASEIVLNKDNIHIKLSPKPLDEVLRRSDLLESCVKIPWQEDKKIIFTLEG